MEKSKKVNCLITLFITVALCMSAMLAVSFTVESNNKAVAAEPTQKAATVKRTNMLDFAEAGLKYISDKGVETTADPTQKNITNTAEGWSWYKTAADGQKANTLLLHGINMVCDKPLYFGLSDDNGVLKTGKIVNLPNDSNINIMEGTNNRIEAVEVERTALGGVANTPGGGYPSNAYCYYTFFIPGTSYIYGNGNLSLVNMQLLMTLRDTRGYLAIGYDGIKNYQPNLTIDGGGIAHTRGSLTIAGGNINIKATRPEKYNVVDNSGHGGTVIGALFPLSGWQSARNGLGVWDSSVTIKNDNTNLYVYGDDYGFAHGNTGDAGGTVIIDGGTTTFEGGTKALIGSPTLSGASLIDGDWNQKSATYGKKGSTSMLSLNLAGTGDGAYGGGYYSSGTVVSISAGTKIGYEFAGWTSSTGGTFANAALSTTTYTVASTSTLTANWLPASYRINYTLNGGSLSNAAKTYTYGEGATLPTPTGWNSYTFGGWHTDALLTEVSKVTAISAADYGDKTFYAKWNVPANQTYILTAKADANGKITPSGSIIYNGVNQDYTITPNQGYRINTFTVGGVEKSGEIVANKYTVSGITANTTLNVTFTAITAGDKTISASAGENGSITPTGITAVITGGSQTYTFTPNAGYIISDVLVDGVSIINNIKNNQYTFINVTANSTISATFKKVEDKVSILNAKFYRNQVWDVARNPLLPIAGQPFTLSNFKAPYSDGGSYTGLISDSNLVDFTDGKYVMFNKSAAYPSLNDIPNTAKNLTLKDRILYDLNTFVTLENVDFSKTTIVEEILYNADGTKNKTLASVGIVWALSDSGFLYTALSGLYVGGEDNSLWPGILGGMGVGTYVTLNAINAGDIITYYPEKDLPNNEEDMDEPLAKPDGDNTDPTNQYVDYAGRVVTSLFEPVARAAVSLTYNSTTYTAVTDTDGYFSIKRIIKVTENNFSANVQKSPYSVLTYPGSFSTSTADNYFVYDAPSSNGSGTIKSTNYLSFRSNGGIGKIPNQPMFSNTITALTANTFTKEGYTFKGWKTSADGISLDYADKANISITSNKTLYAHWAATEYLITYNLNGGINNADNPATYTRETKTTLLAPSRAGYTFDGWYDNVTFNGNAITQIAEGEMSAKEFFAKWTPKTDTAYKVEHYQQNLLDDNFTIVSADTQTLTGTTGANTSATAKSYTGFNANTFSQTEIAADGSTIIKIYYARNTYTVTYIDNGGEHTQTVKHGGNAVTPDITAKTGYDQTAPTWDNDGKNITAARTISAVYTINTYTVTWDIEGVKTTDMFEYNQAPSYTGTTPTKKATVEFTYTFKSWDKEFKPITENITYTAMFNGVKNKYNVTVNTNSNGTVNGGGENIEYGSEIQITATPNKGYVFSKWSDGNTNATRTITVEGNITFSAEFSLSIYDFSRLNTSTPQTEIDAIYAEINGILSGSIGNELKAYLESSKILLDNIVNEIAEIKELNISANALIAGKTEENIIIGDRDNIVSAGLIFEFLSGKTSGRIDSALLAQIDLNKTLCDNLVAKIDTLSANAEQAYKDKIANLEKDIGELNASIKQLEETIAKLEKDLESAQKPSEELQEKIDKLTGEKNELQEKVKSLESEKTKLTQELSKITKELKQASTYGIIMLVITIILLLATAGVIVFVVKKIKASGGK